MRSPTAGFTLIELMVTLAVSGILATVAVGPLAGFVEARRTAAAISTLQSHFALARLTAISRNHSVIICPSPDGQHCLRSSDWSSGWMLFMDQDGDRRPSASDDVLRTELRRDHHHLRITSSGGRRQLRYHPDGTSAGANLTLSICNERGDLLGQVIVNNVGRIRSTRNRASASCPT